MSSKWYALYTKPRWEKKVNALLQEAGYESYCPLNKVRRKWSDRIKLVEEPLFKSYVFVKVREEERTGVRMVAGVINFVYWNGKPALIREREIAAIRRFLNEYEGVEARRLDFRENERVRVTAGPMMDKEGRVLEVRNRVVKICIDSLGYLLVAHIDKSKLTSAHD